MGSRGNSNAPHHIHTGNNHNARVFNTTTIRYRINDTQTFSTAGSDGVAPNVGNNYPLSSMHTGGIQATFCDGSVHFISENINLEVLCRYANRHDGGTVEAP